MLPESNPVLKARSCSPSGCIGIPDAVSSSSVWLYYGVTVVCLLTSCFLLYRWLKDPSRMAPLCAAIGILAAYALGMGSYLSKALKALESKPSATTFGVDIGECNLACDTARQIRDFMEFGVYAVVIFGTAVAVHMFHRWRINQKDFRLLVGSIIISVFLIVLTMVYEIFT